MSNIAIYSDGYNEVEINLNGADALPTTKTGKTAVLRCHAIEDDADCEGGFKLTYRVMTQQQVKQIKESGRYISANDRDWVSRNARSESPALLISDQELSDYIAK